MKVYLNNEYLGDFRHSEGRGSDLCDIISLIPKTVDSVDMWMTCLSVYLKIPDTKVSESIKEHCLLLTQYRTETVIVGGGEK